MNSQKDSWMAAAAAMLVLLTSILDARVSSLLAIGLLLVFAVYRYFENRN